MKTKTILDEICSVKLERINRAKAMLSLEDIYARALRFSVKRPSLKMALYQRNFLPAVIAELKKASPSRGLIREDFNPVELALRLEEAGAAALSVITEEAYFLGSPDYLKKVSESVGIPTLRKDFIFDEYQICEAKLMGASAVLLIAKILNKERFMRLNALAKRLNLDVLAEAHDEREVDFLLECGANIIGVNSRNLSDFSTDIEASLKLIKRIPSNLPRVLESAVIDRETLMRAGDAGASAVLIGTALMSKKFPEAELRNFLAV